MTDTAKATARPWRLGEFPHHILSGEGGYDGHLVIAADLPAWHGIDIAEANAALIVTAVNEYDALKAVDAAARAAAVVLNATMTHRPSAERLHAALAALDAIRKGG